MSRGLSAETADRVRAATRLMVLALCYFVVAAYGALPENIGESVVGLGLPSGLAVASLLVLGPGLWPAIALGAFAARLIDGLIWPAAMLSAAGAALGSFLTARLIGRLSRGLAGPAAQLRDLGVWLAAAAAGSALGVSLDFLAVALGLVTGAEAQPRVWLAGWMTQVLGIATFTPALLAQVSPFQWASCSRTEALIWCALLLLGAVEAFAHWPLPSLAFYGAGLLFPLVTIVGLRCSRRTVSLALMGVVVIGWFCTRSGWGDFAADLADTGLLRFWLYCMLLLTSGLAVSILAADRRRAKASLLQAAGIVESMQEGVMVTDSDGLILSVNPAFTEITGYVASEVIGRHRSLLDADPGDEKAIATRKAALAASGRWQGESWSRRKNGERYPLWQRVSAVAGGRGSTVNYVAVFSDISSLKVSQEELEHLAHHDVLTELPNRLLFRDRLDHAIQRAQRSNLRLALLFLDLDRFKHVNDSLGHSAGDQLLRDVAMRLRSAVRRDDTLARLGGDEFTVLMEGLKDGRDAAVLAEKLLGVLREPFRVQQHELYVSTSIGISIYPQDALTTESLLRNADAAMYRAKDAGRNAYWYYSEEMTSAALDRVVLEAQLRQAIELEQLVLHFQPQVDLGARHIVGVEALVRWNHPTKGFIPPARFIHIAEESGLIIPLGDWVLRAACRQARAWLDAGIEFGCIAVNVSAPQILRGTLYGSVSRVLEATGLPPSLLELEINESFVMEQPVSTTEQFVALRELGVTLAIDDFGTAYSSLAYLRRLPVDKLKIDRSFILDLPHDTNDAGVARAVIALGHSLQFKVVAEGVETEPQHDFLKSEGCDQAQGFLYSQAMDAGEVEKLLRDWPYRDDRLPVPPHA
ncbi:bifunctional diguanylate cyclase/phosphodiesterase [Methylotetracoccus oryzae]|uniref:bifunctional diguanylate cyclase/phosphodiesterase n=1 Tax=Methylotetracoccus oryzae TaxID=1919059 RepID=UPI00111AA76E|nr:EAL domain-containing protein [Methylotetracoccus oryzae]